MGTCTSKPPPKPNPYARKTEPPSPPPETVSNPPTPLQADAKESPLFPFFIASPAHYTSKKNSSSPFRGNFPPPSPSKHLKEFLLRRHGGGGGTGERKPVGDTEGFPELDKNFGFSKQFSSRYEVGEEVGRGYVCSSIVKKGELKGQKVAVKIIPKSKMTTAIAIEDVRMEVKTLRALTGHPNVAKFYEAFEDVDNVYIVME